jgi:hypothetical protein
MLNYHFRECREELEKPINQETRNSNIENQEIKLEAQRCIE